MASACVCGDYFTVGDDGELCLIPGTMGLRQIVVFDEPGASQFVTADYPWLARIRVHAQGGGGGSGGADATPDQCVARPGGAGGGQVTSLIEASALGAVETVVVGAGGTAGSGNQAGGAGDTSSFGGFVVAPGGTGGTITIASGAIVTVATGPSGPAGGTGQIITSGGNGEGAFRLSGTAGMSGQGGDSRFGYGGTGRAVEGAGTHPRGHGAGAGGALSYGAAFDGAAGGDGIVVVELYG
ncbi:hypothetical protein OG896_24435 [Streptomyces sp. NBC_00669]|uniref:glycine-rich domain-containing protein n=1 Tax=Streptomyces sp. NBC_00669 TaxID=2976011 RepID=UPI002E327CAC|nr:hypothetical protein [Streptomyces sp. NBC_00669]